MRFLAWLVVAAMCASPLGCASLNPKNWKGPGKATGLGKRSGGGDRDRIPPPEPPVGPLASGLGGGRAGNGNGLLAGQVIDSFNQRQGGAVIQVTATDASPNEPPHEAAANEQGYFTIQGLQPGRRYKLLARTKKGEQLLAGTVIATPPNAVVLIKVSEDFASSNTPGMPGPGDLSNPPPNPQPRQGKPAATIDSRQGIGAAPKYLHEPDRGHARLTQPESRSPPAARAGPTPPTPNSARLGVPIAPERQIQTPASPKLPNYPALPSHPPPPLRPELMTQDTLATNRQGPTVEIRSGDRRLPPFPGASSTAAPLAQLAPSNAGGRSNGPGLQVPGCVVNGNRVENFALNDLQGRPYQLKDQAGRLVLLDFWGTWCQPCIQALPHVQELHRRYGAQGLEVVGIAYEMDGTFVEKAQRVNFVRQRQGVGYKILLGEGDNCPVRTKLGVNAFPTLVLLDAHGDIVWRSEGLTPQNQSALDSEIRRRLASR